MFAKGHCTVPADTGRAQTHHRPEPSPSARNQLLARPLIELALDDPREERLFAADDTTPDAGNRVGR